MQKRNNFRIGTAIDLLVWLQINYIWDGESEKCCDTTNGTCFPRSYGRL